MGLPGPALGTPAGGIIICAVPEVVLSTWLRPGEVALRAALSARERSGDILDWLTEGLAAAEEDPELIAIGRGSVPNRDGEIELDAAIMRGDTLAAGAVCGLQGILPAIRAARWVMERTEHVMLCGGQARRFAIEQGLRPQNTMTAEAIRRYDEWRNAGPGRAAYVHSIEDEGLSPTEPIHDTITMLALKDGLCAAASSTSGKPFKLPGRVGDSPIVGAGIYADDEVGCAGATGWGEELWKACASFRAVQLMEQGRSAQEACEATVDHMKRRQPGCLALPCVVLALRRDGDLGAAVIGGEFDLWVEDGSGPRSIHYDDRA
jgi:isoaspartyl peptidase/L-asparaginase-like protein (Ntn-hydrolase superfamily)